MLLSDIRNRRQQRKADCLVACALMVLDYLGIQRNAAWVEQLLESSELGTPFPNLARLANPLGVVAEVEHDGTLDTFPSCIELGLPVIVAVDADAPQFWPHVRNHAVVVVGFDSEHVYVNNPAVQKAPQEVKKETLLWAWAQRDYAYAVIRLTTGD